MAPDEARGVADVDVAVPAQRRGVRRRDRDVRHQKTRGETEMTSLGRSGTSGFFPLRTSLRSTSTILTLPSRLGPAQAAQLHAVAAEAGEPAGEGDGAGHGQVGLDRVAARPVHLAVHGDEGLGQGGDVVAGPERSSRLTRSWIDGDEELEMRTVIDFCPPSNSPSVRVIITSPDAVVLNLPAS